MDIELPLPRYLPDEGVWLSAMDRPGSASPRRMSEAVPRSERVQSAARLADRDKTLRAKVDDTQRRLDEWESRIHADDGAPQGIWDKYRAECMADLQTQIDADLKALGEL